MSDAETHARALAALLGATVTVYLKTKPNDPRVNTSEIDVVEVEAPVGNEWAWVPRLGGPWIKSSTLGRTADEMWNDLVRKMEMGLREEQLMRGYTRRP